MKELNRISWRFKGKVLANIIEARFLRKIAPRRAFLCESHRVILDSFVNDLAQRTPFKRLEIDKKSEVLFSSSLTQNSESKLKLQSKVTMSLNLPILFT